MQSWEQTLKEQKALHTDRAYHRLVDMAELVDSLEQSPGDMQLLRHLSQHFHQLAGSAGILESPEYFSLAQSGEVKAGTAYKQQQQLDEETCQQFRQIIADLKAALDELKKEEKPREQTSEKLLAGLLSGIIAMESTEDKYVLMSRLDEDLVDELADHLAKRKLSVRLVTSSEEARTEIKNNLPEALIVNVVPDDSESYSLAEFLRAMPGGDKPPIIFLTSDSQFIDQVKALRSGVDVVFDTAYSATVVGEKLEYLLDRDKPENYRILSVEDDPAWAGYIATVLEAAGYSVLLVNDASLFEQTLLAYDPQLVLLDINLGEFSGHDLAKYLRQMDRYANLPIIFLTTQFELESHIASARAGGDLHLVKPIAPPLLVAAVAGRLERYRMLERLISRDGLTNCMTYGAFMDELKKTVATPGRTRSLLLFELRDIWQVNDAFGFATGDKLIAVFANILKKSLRPTEIIGRLAGGKFAVLMDGLQSAQMEAIAAYVLGQLAATETMISGVPVKIAGNAGIAVHRPRMDMKSWLHTAEEALKAAKDKGPGSVSES